MTLGLSVGIVAALACAALVGGARSATDASGTIAFFRPGSGIFTMHADGSGARPLRRVGPAAHGLAWSPDGSRLALASGTSGVWAMDADGSHPARLFADGKSPTWSPDGRTIAFVARRGGNPDIWVMNADGTKQRRLLRTPSLFEVEVDWGPSGRLAVTTIFGYVPDVHVMDSDGSDRRLLTPGRFEGLEPDWSPNGRRIALTRWRSRWSDDIYVADPARSSRLRLLTKSVLCARDPAWSPDGRRIAFVRRQTVACIGTPAVWAMNADGTHERRLTKDGVAALSPAWQSIARP